MGAETTALQLKCKQCGTAIPIPPEILADATPRVECPQCRARYRLKPRNTGTVSPPGAVATASPVKPHGDAPTRVTARPAAKPPAAKTSVFAPGDLLAERYRVVRFLAQGGMGEVYEAEDLELRENVALKTISARHDQDAALDRFKREIQLARKVSHANVCRIFDLGQHRADDGESITFLTMELLRGETLSQRLRQRGRLPVGEALPIAQGIAKGLHAAHQARIIHRDLKSENIFLVPRDDGLRVVVTDFGIARGGADDRFAAMVTGGGILGTPAYMAPEQVRGEAVAPAADLYAFGVVLYEMVTGKMPFLGDSPLTIAVKRLQEDPPTPCVHVPDLDPNWERVILRCLEREPGKRFATALEVGHALEGMPTAPGTGAPWPTGQQPTSATWQPTGSPVAEPPTATRSTAAPLTLAPTPTPTATPTPTPTAMMTGGMVAVAGSAKQEGRRGVLVYALLAVLALSGALALFNRLYNPDSHRRVVPRRSVAVLGLENLTGREDIAWMSTALAEMLGTELARGDGLRTIPGERVAELGRELDLATAQEVGAEVLERMHSVLACDFVVLGSYAGVGGDGGEHIRLDLRLADAARGVTLASVGRDGSQGELFEMVRGLGDELRDALGVKAGGGDDPFAGQPQDRGAARLYAEALEKMRLAQPLEARDLLQEAVGLEPQNPLLHSALSSAHETLGYHAKAAEHAERAFELSSELPREERLMVEGRYREMRQDLPAAIQAYQQLWDYFPDDLEYGLRLAAAQTAARRPNDAALTVEQLRALPPPLNADPRIELADASLAALLGDFARQRDAAGRAVGLAEQVGGRLFVAQARLAEAQAARRLGEWAEAAAAAEEAVEAYREIDNPSGTAVALTEWANVHAERDQPDEARRRYEEALAVYRRLGAQGGVASVLNNLAVLEKKKGDLDRARELYEEAAEIYETTGNAAGRINVANNFGALLVDVGELGRARAEFERVLEVWEAEGNKGAMAVALNNVAVVLRHQGELYESRRKNDRALALRREIGDKLGEVYSLSNLGAVLGDLGEIPAAVETLNAGKILAESLEHRSSLAQVLYELAEIHRYTGRYDEAEGLHGEALEIRRELGEGNARISSEVALVRVRLDQEEYPTVEIAAGRAISLCEQGGRRDDAAYLNALLAEALLAQDRVAEARRASERASDLAATGEHRVARFQAEYVAARLNAVGGRTASAAQRLLDLEIALAESGDVPLRLEARLARARILRASNPLEARKLFEDVRDNASARGMAGFVKRASAELR